ncbi:MAG: carbohydrate binding domain-containing protein, partial [Verrucomicrobia bacterium]|nr:carbohydrate binding domain-containing protein [Verrucomicrobiota bacterium]
MVPLSNSSFTLEAWARRDSSSSIDIILGQGSVQTDQGLHFGFHQGEQSKFVLGFYYDDLFTADSYTDNHWHHWAATYDAGTKQRRIYRDGVLVASGVASASYQGSGAVIIGDTAWGGGAFHGRIDDVRIWNKARTQTEIAADMIEPLTGAEPNLIAYWSCDDASTNMARDATQNHFDGILANGTTRVSALIAAPNLAVNPGFEQGTGGWWPFGSTTLRNSSLWPHSGTNCVWVTNRTEAGQGLQQQFETRLQPGLDYLISAWVRLDNAASQPMDLSMLKTDSSGTSYPRVADGTATSNLWTRLSG